MSKDIIKRLRAAEFVSFVCEDAEASIADFDLAKQAARTIAALQEQLADARAFLADFAAHDFVAEPAPPLRHPADELDPLTDAMAVWAWQDDAREIAAQRATQPPRADRVMAVLPPPPLPGPTPRQLFQPATVQAARLRKHGEPQ